MLIYSPPFIKAMQLIFTSCWLRNCNKLLKIPNSLFDPKSKTVSSKNYANDGKIVIFTEKKSCCLG